METIEEYLNFLLKDGLSASVTAWPPDAFACAASLLERSGGYLGVVDEWPPEVEEPHASWTEAVCEMGKRWSEAAVASNPPPAGIERAWNLILGAGALEVRSIGRFEAEAKTVRNALLLILAAADEACEGAGIPGDEFTPFQIQISQLLVAQRVAGHPSTLCRWISTSKLSVLPKLHTPQTGISIRSLSHHVALCTATEVSVRWTGVDQSQIAADRHGLNVLIVPWPLEIRPSSFSSVNGALANLPPNFGFFQYQIRGGERLDMERLEKLINRASETSGPVDMVVFPELALEDGDLERLAGLIAKLPHRPIIIGGVGQAVGVMSQNTSVTIVPTKDGNVFGFRQFKHHRWLLDGNQVKQYGLGSVLDPTVSWWENAALSQRELGFFSLHPWLTLCTLICEDLARPDPIANLVRAIGPNLVVALLMDGPQLSNRWPARYATVLADDPGSSVLTVSPLGMVQLSRPPGKPISNVIAMWKDAPSGAPVEISLPPDCDGVLLSLTRVLRLEFTADGRDDGASAAHITLSGIHPIRR